MNRRTQKLQPREAAVLTSLAADGAMTAMDLGQDSGLYPNGGSATWAGLGRLLVHPLRLLRMLRATALMQREIAGKLGRTVRRR